MDWKLSLAGLLIGGLVGLTGMGGGSLMTPLLVIVFGFSPTLAIGTDLAHGAIFKTAGAVAASPARNRARAAVRLDVPRQRAVLDPRRLARARASPRRTATARNR